MGVFRDAFEENPGCYKQPGKHWVFGPGVTDKQLERLERHLGKTLPVDVRDMFEEFDGIKVQDYPNYFTVEEILRDDYSGALNDNNPSGNFDKVLFLCHENGTAELYGICLEDFGTFRTGEIVLIDHDLVDDPDPFEPAYPNLLDLLRKGPKGGVERIVLRFDVEKVKSLRFHGWAAGGKVCTLEFDRDGAKQWAAKTANYKLDPTKLNSLLQRLRHVTCWKCSVVNGGATLLDEKDHLLTIETSVDGEVTPLVLVIGAFNEIVAEKLGQGWRTAHRDSQYVLSSMWPGDVFLIDGLDGSFAESMLKNPAYFSYHSE